MFNHVDHPDVPVRDWQKFLAYPSPYQANEVIARRECDLPDWYVPLARGVAIADDELLRYAGYDEGMRPPQGWHQTHCDVFEFYTDFKTLKVRGFNPSLWMIERWGSVRPHVHSNEVLVCLFGSIPMCTRSCSAAMCLAMQYDARDPAPLLYWIAACPEDYELATEIARKRGIEEAVAQ